MSETGKAREWVSSRFTRYGMRAPSAPVPLTEDVMTTPRTRAIVSFLAAVSVTVVSGACAGGPSRLGHGGTTQLSAPSPVIFFDNDARDHVHVYLVSDERQWFLGRIEAGIRAPLRIPEEALVANPRRLQLAVLVGGALSPRVTMEPRATFTIAQPASLLLLQDWRFSQEQLISVPIGRARAAFVP